MELQLRYDKLIDFSDPIKIIYTLKGIGKPSFSFNFIFPYIHIYFAMFISKNAFSREQSYVVFEKITQENNCGHFLVIVDYPQNI